MHTWLVVEGRQLIATPDHDFDQELFSEFLTEILEYMKENGGKTCFGVALDCIYFRRVSSRAMGWLALLYKGLYNMDIPLSVIGISPDFQHTLDTCGLATYFNFAVDKESAIKFLQSQMTSDALKLNG